MMDEQLRDNVERLLKGKGETPSPEFAARVETLLRSPAPPRRRMALLAVAAILAFAFILWIALHDASPRGTTAQSGPKVTGTVTFRGIAPRTRVYKVGNYDPNAEAFYPNGLRIDPVPMDAEHRVQDCLVYVKRGLEGVKFQIPQEPKHVVFDKFLIRPRIMGMMVGQPLIVESLDTTLHNAHALPRDDGNKEFNDGLPGSGEKYTRTFQKPEIGLKLKCDVHQEWEASWITVLSHPFYAVTDSHGRFEFAGLPPGKYTLEAWQENCEPVTREIEVKPDGTVNVDFELTARPPFVTIGQLRHDPERVKELEGRVVELWGERVDLHPDFRANPPLREGRLYIKLKSYEGAGYCGVAKELEAFVKSIPEGKEIRVRGVLKSGPSADGSHFLLEDCSLIEPSK